MIETLSDFPPKPYLELILRSYPRAGLTYIKLWENRDKDNKIAIYKKEISDTFLTSHTIFKNNLLALSREHLVNVDDCPLMYVIELTNWDNQFNGLDVC